MERGAKVRVPASSANLGPGFDCFAIALALHLEVEVVPAAGFSVVTDLDLPTDRTNLVVRAFERLTPADGYEFRISSQIPLSGGLGSSAAAVVAGLAAADAVLGGGADLLTLATDLEGHPDNAAAALLGGFVICPAGEGAQATRLDIAAGLAAVLVVPHEAVRTQEARAALPAEVPLGDAVHNAACAAQLALGITSGDFGLLQSGLGDRLHQPYREHLYPRSMRLVREASSLGALGATISGAGPAVLVWCAGDDREALTASLAAWAGDWAKVLPVAFEPTGLSLR